jgi:hypothetical protein
VRACCRAVQASVATAVDSAVTAVDSAITAVDSAVTAVDSAVTAVDSAVTAVDSAVTAVDSAVTAVDSAVTAVDSAVTAVDSAVTYRVAVFRILSPQYGCPRLGLWSFFGGFVVDFAWHICHFCLTLQPSVFDPGRPASDAQGRHVGGRRGRGPPAVAALGGCLRLCPAAVGCVYLASIMKYVERILWRG